MHSDRTIIVVIVVVIAAIVVVALLLSRRNKTVALQRRFGQEYERTVTEHGSEREVQAVLEQRQKRAAHFNIRKLSVFADTLSMFKSRFSEKRGLNDSPFERCGSFSSAI